MNERRTSGRWPLPVDRQGLMLYGQRRHLYGKAMDQSVGGVGVVIEEDIPFQVGDHVLIHQLHDRQLRLATIRHTQTEDQGGLRLGLQWCQ